MTKAYKILLFGGLGGAVFMGLEAENIIRLVASAEFLTPVYGSNSADILRVVSSVFGLFFLSSLATYVLIASEHQGRLLRINLTIALLNLIANALVIPYYGAMGSAVVTVLCQALLLVILARSTRDVIVFGYAPRYTLTVIVSALIAGITLSLFPTLSGSVFISLIVS